MNTSTQEDTSAVGFAATLLVLGFLGALGILGYQIYFYLRSGYWLSLSIITVLGWLGSEWALDPKEWLGLYKILEWIPLAAACFLLGLFFSWAAFSYDELRSGREKERLKREGRELRRTLGYDDEKK